MTTVNTVLLVAAAVLGSIVGSFLNVVIYRLPRGEFFAKGPRSVCPACGKRIAWYDNLPILGWLHLRGKARCCGARISLRYPIIEALTSGCFAALWLWPPSGMAWSAEEMRASALLAFAFHAWFLALLIACAFIDVDHRILPDALTKPGMAVGCLSALLVPGLRGSFGIVGVSAPMDSLLFSVAGLLLGFGATWLVRVLARVIFAKEAMGFGDVKLMGMMGAFLGWQDVLLAFLIGCLLGAVGGLLHRWITRDPYIYFGPFLAMGGVITLFLAPAMLDGLAVAQEWQRTNPAAPPIVIATAILSLVLLVFLVRRGRAR